MDNEQYISEYIQTRQLKKTTYFTIKGILTQYSEQQGLSLHELLIEADDEEEQGIRWKRRTLKKRLINYQNFLHNHLNSLNSIRTYYKTVKAFYNHNEIEIGKLPPLNLKNNNVPVPIKATDLPDKEIILKAYETTNQPVMKALLLFLSSSGMSKVDALNLNVNQFLKGTFEYHQKTEINEILTKLSEMDGIIPTWEARRSKTNKFFITFNTPEATDEIIVYLTQRLKKTGLKKTDKLFKINPSHYTRSFQQLNDMLGLGTVGTYNRLRGHALRKFHATTLAKSGLDKYTINILQGKSNSAVDSAYFYEDEKHLKQQYIKHMDSLMILNKVKTVTEYSAEYLSIKYENDQLKQKLNKIDELENILNGILDWYED